MSKSGRLNGQWHGTYAGSSTGHIIINIDEAESNYRGVAYLCGEDKSLPGSAAGFGTADKNKEFTFRTDWILALERASGQAIPLEDITRNTQA